MNTFLSILFVKGDGLLPSAELRNVDFPQAVGPATMRSLFLVNNDFSVDSLVNINASRRKCLGAFLVLIINSVPLWL